MRTIACWLLLGTVGAGMSPVVFADSPPHPLEVWKVALVRSHDGISATEAAPLETTVTFTEAVRVGNLIVPAGTYLVRMVTPSILRISSTEDTRIDATFAMRTVARSGDSNEALVLFNSQRSNWPRRVIAIFPENASVGYRLSNSDRRQRDVLLASSDTR